MLDNIERHDDGDPRYYRLSRPWVHPKPDRRLAAGWRSGVGYHEGQIFEVRTRHHKREIEGIDLSHLEIEIRVGAGAERVTIYVGPGSKVDPIPDPHVLDFAAALVRDTSTRSKARESLGLYYSYSEVMALEALCDLMERGIVSEHDLRETRKQIEAETD